MSEVRRRKILIFRTIKEISEYVAKRWAEASGEEIDRKRRFTVALSGGKTPARLYRSLADPRRVLRWDKIHFFLADERFVLPGDPDSNYGMIKRNLLDHIDIPGKNFHPITILRTARLSAQKYERDMEAFFCRKNGDFPQFDLIMLGIGEDGHTASLFPGHPALAEDKRWAVAVRTNKAKRDRISLTLPVINRAKAVFFLVTGKRKARIIKRLLEGPKTGLPASLVEPARGEILFLLDRGASSLLSKIRTDARTETEARKID